MTTTLTQKPASAAEILADIMLEDEHPSEEHRALSVLRKEIDSIDEQMLDLFQRRLGLAARVGLAKDAPHGAFLRLRPDREQHVVNRIVALAEPERREAVQALWREIIGWGLARQGRLEVRVWAPETSARAFDGARRRFGTAARIKAVEGPEDALKFASEGHGVAVLAVNSGDPWWMGLRRDWSNLSVFEGLGGMVDPTALAVGQIDEAALPKGRRVVVSAGGDAGDGYPRLNLATHHGWSLYLTDEPLELRGIEGCVGAIG